MAILDKKVTQTLLSSGNSLLSPYRMRIEAESIVYAQMLLFASGLEFYPQPDKFFLVILGDRFAIKFSLEDIGILEVTPSVIDCLKDAKYFEVLSSCDKILHLTNWPIL